MINTRFLRCANTASATFGAPVLFALLAIVSTLFISGCQTEQTASVATSEDGSSDQQIRKSPNDSREYRYLVLPNKMRVVLVSDPETDKSAAAMAVYRGSFHEPEHRPGLAHFLEHMLFIQTEAYPEPGAFQKFVAANGGSTNAYTAFDHTNYFFNVAPQAFPEALDRWAHFFIKPIISAEYSEREKNAVQSEYQMQIKDDGWRNYMVGKQALNPEHPATRFTIGSLDTLAGDIQADLIDFFETQYSADQMGLVLISNQSLDELEALVKPLFSQVANKDIGPAYVDTPMYTDEQLPQWVANQTFKDGATLTFAFPLPSTLPHYKTKPEQYFANLIGHEGTGSLYQYLVGKGWIESLGSGVSVFDRGTSVLNVSIELTPAGDQHKQDIAHALFSYIELIKSSPPKAWLY
ncbi:MAG: insulinase family protein, partial [Pseudomonadales bacterium]